MDLRIPPLKIQIPLESNKPPEIYNLITEIGRRWVENTAGTFHNRFSNLSLNKQKVSPDS